jgi:hypothetical protein
MSNLAALSSTLGKTSDSVERMPELMAEARKAVLADVQSQRLAAQAFVSGERMQVLDALNQQRVAMMSDLRGERLAATADLRRERQIVLDALHNEQAAVMSDLHAAGAKAISDFDARSRGLIDHFFLRALELVLLALVLYALVTWLVLRRFAIRRRYPGERSYDRAA